MSLGAPPEAATRSDTLGNQPASVATEHSQVAELQGASHVKGLSELNSSRQNIRPSRKRASIAAAENSTPDSLNHRYEQYVLLARQSAQAGDKIEAENLLQHAEHWYRTIALRKAGHQQ